MAINFTQTDAEPTECAPGEFSSCSGLSVGSESFRHTASDGGTAGSTPDAISTNGSGSRLANAIFKCAVAAGVTWAAGTWTVRFNVTTSNMNITVSDIFICRVNSACTSQETIGSATGLSISCGTTGVKSQTVTGSAVTPSADDFVLVVIAFSNGAMTSQDISITPDQNIDSPFTAAAAVLPQRSIIISQAVSRAASW